MKQVCQERRACHQNCQQEGLSRFRDDKRKGDGEKVASSEKEVEREMSRRKRRPDKDQATGRAVKIQRCQEQAGSRESGSVRQDAEKKKWQGQRINGRASQPLSLQPSLPKLPSPSLPGLYCYSM
jgi:hypothetical protein